MILAGHEAHMSKKRNTCESLVDKPEDKRKLGKPRCRKGSNIRMSWYK
jgi:hypothetical protein